MLKTIAFIVSYLFAIFIYFLNQSLSPSRPPSESTQALEHILVHEVEIQTFQAIPASKKILDRTSATTHEMRNASFLEDHRRMLPEQKLLWLSPFLLSIPMIFLIGWTEYRHRQLLRSYKENEENEKFPIRMMSEEEDISALTSRIVLAFEEELERHRSRFKNEVGSVKKTMKKEHELYTQLQDEEGSLMRMLNVGHKSHAQFQNEMESVKRVMNVEHEPYAQFSKEEIIELVDNLIPVVQRKINSIQIIEEDPEQPVDCQDELEWMNEMMRLEEECHARVQRGTIPRW
jgi:hypothetical protein